MTAEQQDAFDTLVAIRMALGTYGGRPSDACRVVEEIQETMRLAPKRDSQPTFKSSNLVTELRELESILGDSPNRTAQRRVDDATQLLRGIIIRAMRSASETPEKQVIQHVYTRDGRAAVTGIPGPDHDCDAMACSSLEHILARVPHTVDEPPVKTSADHGPQCECCVCIAAEVRRVQDTRRDQS